MEVIVRPIAKQSSGMKYPLDELLGSQGNVRLLRTLLYKVDTPLSAPDAARLAGLTLPGARKALEKLIVCGVVERIGSGRATQYGVRRNAPLFDVLSSLFLHEGERYDGIIASLKNVLTDVPEIRSAWLGVMSGEAGRPVELNVVVDASAMGWISEELRVRIGCVEQEYDLVLELILFTRADSPHPDPEAVFLMSPEVWQKTDRRNAPQSHSDKEKRALVISRQIADMIREDPSLVTRARQHLHRLLHDGQGTATGDLLEWRQLLEAYPAERIRQLLISDTSRARRLRQTLPFFAVLDAVERERVLDALEKRP